MCISRETLEGLRFTGMFHITLLYNGLPLLMSNVVLTIIIHFHLPQISLSSPSPFCSLSLPLPSKVKGVTKLVRYLLQQPGVQYVLTAKLSQDSLESFFGKQRMQGGYSDNPNVATFLYGAQSLRVQCSAAVKPTQGNCKRGRTKESIVVD